jgi:hypothetical protein
MVWTQEQFDALEAATAEGVLSVQYQDRKVTYHSLAEMLRLLDQMRNYLAGADAPVRRKYAQFSKGLE